MSDPSSWIPWLVLTPLVAAVLCVVLPGLSRAIGLGAWVAVGFPLGALLNRFCCEGVAEVRHVAGGWQAPLGIELAVTGSDLFMLSLVWLVGVGVSVYALAYFGSEKKAFWPLWMLLWAGLSALIVSRDLFNLYVTLELIGLSAAALTALSGDAAAIRAAVRYLMMGLLGSLLYLLGVALMYAEFGSVDVATLKSALGESPGGGLALALMTVGLLVKGAVFPAHVWLPPAHANAPAPVSALLSALVVKGAFLILVRLWVDVFPADMTAASVVLLGTLGGIGVLWGVGQAMVQERLKMLIAYSTVAQLGYLTLCLPLLLASGAAWPGVMMLLAGHALAKTAFFLAAGNVLHAAGHDRIAGLGGVLPRLPLTAFAMGLAGLSLMGLPPSGGFLGKWLLLGVAFEHGHRWIVGVLVVGGVLASIYVFRVVSLAFSGEEPREGEAFHKPSKLMEASALGMAVLAVALGVFSKAPLELISLEGGLLP